VGREERKKRGKEKNKEGEEKKGGRRGNGV